MAGRAANRRAALYRYRARDLVQRAKDLPAECDRRHMLELAATYERTADAWRRCRRQAKHSQFSDRLNRSSTTLPRSGSRVRIPSPAPTTLSIYRTIICLALFSGGQTLQTGSIPEAAGANSRLACARICKDKNRKLEDRHCSWIMVAALSTAIAAVSSLHMLFCASMCSAVADVR